MGFPHHRNHVSLVPRNYVPHGHPLRIQKNPLLHGVFHGFFQIYKAKVESTGFQRTPSWWKPCVQNAGRDITVFHSPYFMVGGWPTPTRNIRVRQLGLWQSKYDGKVIYYSMVPNHQQPVSWETHMEKYGKSPCFPVKILPISPCEMWKHRLWARTSPLARPLKRRGHFLRIWI